MTKKIRLLFLILTIAALILSSCGAGIDGGDTPDPSDSEEQNQPSSDWEKDYPLSKADMFDLVLFDGDGDGERDEVLKITLLDMFGGAGQYLVEVFVESEDSWGYEKIFDSEEYPDVYKNMNVSCTPLSDGKVAFDHEASGYHVEYTVSEEDHPHLFYEDGSPNHCDLLIDSFYHAESEDVDGDGCEELILSQYSSLGWHANYIGDCVTVFKLNGHSLGLVDLYFHFLEE